jgi:hypothetical protein
VRPQGATLLCCKTNRSPKRHPRGPTGGAKDKGAEALADKKPGMVIIVIALRWRSGNSAGGRGQGQAPGALRPTPTPRPCRATVL